MGAFNGELYELGYRFNTASNKEVAQTPDQLVKKKFQEHLNIASRPCIGSCGQRCPNHHCDSHNGEPYRPPNMTWEEYVKFARNKGYVFRWSTPEVKP